jgi:hypothetical protein
MIFAYRSDVPRPIEDEGPRMVGEEVGGGLTCPDYIRENFVAGEV